MLHAFRPVRLVLFGIALTGEVQAHNAHVASDWLYFQKNYNAKEAWEVRGSRIRAMILPTRLQFRSKNSAVSIKYLRTLPNRTIEGYVPQGTASIIHAASQIQTT